MIAILKYNAGNTTSVYNAIKRLGYDVIITDNIVELQKAEKVIFPGVGEASSAMKYLKDRGLDSIIKNLKQPVLGICLGMQLLCDYSEEGDTKAIGIFPNKVLQFPSKGIVPHMGWNNFTSTEGSLFKNLSSKSDFYFVHSYYVESNDLSIATTDYILPYAAALQKDNFYAVQFHPEKSAENGIQLLKNFLELGL